MNKDNDKVKSKNQSYSKEITKFNIWQIFIYFIIYSVIGYFIEITFGLLTKGVLESRQGFLYGPFCPIYGVGAVIMIVFLQYFKKNKYTLFFGGFIIGSITEYLVSLFGELMFNVKWWDYSHMPFNIKGRICVSYSLFWGILAIYLIMYFNPAVDKIILKLKTKIGPKLFRSLTITIFILLIIDFILTMIALRFFFARLVKNYDLELKNSINTTYIVNNSYNYEKKFENLAEKIFSDKKMLRTFPNLKLSDKYGNIIYVRNLLKHIQPYYIKVFTPRSINLQDFQNFYL